LRTLVLSPNVNDYDTGEYLYPNNNNNNYSDNEPETAPVSNNLSYRFAYDQRSGVIFDLSQEKNEEVEHIEEEADEGEENNNEYY
jgi:hypothetical protein